MRCPKATLVSRSWDFVPSDVIRPLAITTIGTAAIAARRLGMAWKQFDPIAGAFTAEGNHQVIVATVIRGLGLVRLSLCPLFTSRTDWAGVSLHPRPHLRRGHERSSHHPAH